jgi:succinate dehydrogenase / fumarate reductase cytochrome b subunit
MGEIALMAAVLYHAFNGFRISILDFKPELWKYQKQSATIVWVLFFVVFIPIGILMFNEFLHGCSARGAACWQFPLPSDFTN